MQTAGDSLPRRTLLGRALRRISPAVQPTGVAGRGEPGEPRAGREQQLRPPGQDRRGWGRCRPRRGSAAAPGGDHAGLGGEADFILNLVLNPNGVASLVTVLVAVSPNMQRAVYRHTGK